MKCCIPLASLAIYLGAAANTTLSEGGGENCLAHLDVEISFLQDASSSFNNWLPRAREIIPEVATSLQKKAQSVKASLLSFSDKPVANAHGCIHKLVEVTSDLDYFRSEASRLKTLGTGGDDYPECGFDAATYAVGSGYGVSPYRPGDRTIRLVAMITDAKGKVDLFETLDDPEHNLYCGERDRYVTKKQVLSAMRKHNAFWLLMIPEQQRKETEWWRNWLKDANNGNENLYMVSNLDLEGSDVVNSIAGALTDLACGIDTISTSTANPSDPLPPDPLPPDSLPPSGADSTVVIASAVAGGIAALGAAAAGVFYLTRTPRTDAAARHAPRDIETIEREGAAFNEEDAYA